MWFGYICLRHLNCYKKMINGLTDWDQNYIKCVTECVCVCVVVGEGGGGGNE